MTIVAPKAKIGSSPDKVFTGRAFLFWLVVSFGIVFAVNFTMAYLAISSFAGDVPNSYEVGQRYSAELVDAAAQEARHWQVAVLVKRAGATDRATVSADFRDHAGRALSGLTVKASLEHPASLYLDRAGTLSEIAPGRFSGTLDHVTSGGWTLAIVAERDGAIMFRSRNRVSLIP